jgi:hypothetical protein
MVKAVLVCAIALLAGCGRNGFKSSPDPDGGDGDGDGHVPCRGVECLPVNLLDGGEPGDEDAAVEEGQADGSVDPVDDAGNGSDGGQEPGDDASTGDSSVPSGLAPETLVGRWTVSTAVSKMCNTDVTKSDVVDGPGVYEDDAPFDVEASLDVVWLKALLYEDCTTPQCQLTRNKTYSFDSFDGSTLVAVLEEPQNYRRFVLEIVFADETAFEGVITTEGLDGFCPCGGGSGTAEEPCGSPLRALRGVRE